jgi:hypothetical protein
MSKLMLDGERKHDKAKLQLHLKFKACRTIARGWIAWSSSAELLM